MDSLHRNSFHAGIPYAKLGGKRMEIFHAGIPYAEIHSAQGLLVIN